MKAPICLIGSTADDKLVVNPEAINILSKLNQPVVVVSIVGLYRTGKSYLMNKLAGARKGFDVGSTVRAQTKGIWMWCVPHPTKANCTLVLLDTEGLGDVEKADGKRDIRIFALAVLLSSALVYNSKGTIDQDAMNKLRFVGEISELIKIKSKNNEDEENELSGHFPIFIWAVRDFHLGLELDGRRITEDEYLENALKLKTPEKTTKDEDYNRLRKRIRVYFGTRKCFTFGLPSADEAVLQNLQTAPDNVLNEKFAAQCQKFCNYIFSNVGVKSVQDMLTVTGYRLGELVKIYTEALSNSKFACMEEAVVSLAEQENQAAVEEALKFYTCKMLTVQLPTNTLAGFLEQSRKFENEARQIFLKRSFKDHNQVFLKECMQNLLIEKNKFMALNESRSLEVCNALIDKLSSNMELALARGMYYVRGGHAQFKQDMKAMTNKYGLERGKGVKAEEALQTYIKSKQSAEIDIIQQDNALDRKEKEAAEENNRRKMLEMEAQFRKQLEDQDRQREAENRASLQQTIEQLTWKMQEDRKMMRENMERIIHEKSMEQQLYMQQGLQEQANRFQEQVDRLLKENKEADKLLQKKEKETQQLLNMRDDQIKKLEKDLEILRKKLQEKDKKNDKDDDDSGCIIL